MIILIAGSTHTGKTLLAQRILEEYKYPYLSLDHLKMGLIRSGFTSLTPYDDDKLTPYLWQITKEIIRTAVENEQNLVIEGCYIPFDYLKDFTPVYAAQIQYRCLIMTDKYINRHFNDITAHSCAIEARFNDDITAEIMLRDNAYNLMMCQKHGCEYILIDSEYKIETDWAKK